MFHRRHAAVGDDEMTLFWTTFNSHGILPVAIALIAAIGGFVLARRGAPDMAAAWHRSITPNTPSGGSS